MSLRLRLTLVIVAVVAVMGVVSLVSFRLNRGIEGRVSDLARTSSAPIAADALPGQTLSIEGSWSEAGLFVASDIEQLPRSRRPQVRGAIQAVDLEGRSVTVLGRRIGLTAETTADVPGSTDGLLERLSVGERVEIGCQVEPDGSWTARKVELAGVKQSDKLKGRVTRVDLASAPLRTLEIEGHPVGVPADVEVTYPQGPLYRMEIATQMTLSIEEALAAAQELLKLRYRERELRARGEPGAAPRLDGAIDDAEDRLEDAAESFAHYLSESRGATEAEIRIARLRGGADRARAEEERVARWLVPLEDRREVLETHASELASLAGRDPDAAQAFLQEVLEPALRTEVAPFVRSYLLETEEDLGLELAAIAARAEDAARLAILTNVAGVALAVAAGLVLSRSISGPILALRDAARAIGHGELGTRVEVRSRDEIGVLAEAVNRMAEELAATTVSVARLDNVIDSMAGALVIVDAQGRIASVNQAALELLGYGQDELVGRPFETICPGGDVSTRGERTFLRRDGASLPVSFSSAGLRGSQGTGGGCVCLALDLTERKRMEEELRRSLTEKELLLREVHHRVKNNLQVISSLLDLQSRSISDPQSLVHFQESQDRIRSMVFIHDQLHRTDDLESVDLRGYLELLVAHLAQSHVDPPGRIQLRTELEPLRLDLDRALACGLIVNELVTNALKHAFPPGVPGEVCVTCRSQADGSIALEVVDNGRGFEGEPGEGNGLSLGMSLVRTLARQLRGRLVSSGRAGASFRVEFPAAAPQEVC